MNVATRPTLRSVLLAPLLVGAYFALAAASQSALLGLIAGAAGFVIVMRLSIEPDWLGQLSSREAVALIALGLAFAVLGVVEALLWAEGLRWLAAGCVVLGAAAAQATRVALHSTITDITTRSFYLPMRDGVRLAITLYLPRMRGDARLPTILLQTRYGRAARWRFPFNLMTEFPSGPSRNTKPLVRAGYAYVAVDVRGSGASFGESLAPLAPQEREDALQVVDWITAQPWSDRQVGVEGVSYNGTAGELLLAYGHPAIKAAMPQFTLFDAYADIIRPGGIQLTGFLDAWDAYARHLDDDKLADLLGEPAARLVTTVPVDGWEGRALLRQVLAVRAGRPKRRALELVRQVQYRDDCVGGFATSAMSPSGCLDALHTSSAEVFAVSGWYDGGYAGAAVKRLREFPDARHKILIGPWDHGGLQVIDPEAKEARPFAAGGDAIRFFDSALKGVDNGYAALPRVRYFTLGADRWNSAAHWPPETARDQVFYLDETQSLTESVGADGADEYVVDASATTGDRSRWVSYANLRSVRIGYEDRADANMQSYSTAAFDLSQEITGSPLARLWLAAENAHAQVFVYLEDVAPDGRVTMITEGQLNIAHRGWREGDNAAASRSFARADASVAPPRTPTEIVVPLLPISYYLRAGHQLRMSVAGADAGNFEPPPPGVLRIHRGARTPSHICVPIVRVAEPMT